MGMQAPQKPTRPQHPTLKGEPPLLDIFDPPSQIYDLINSKVTTLKLTVRLSVHQCVLGIMDNTKADMSTQVFSTGKLTLV